ncbi:PepSY domain-containing protein [Thalassotalea sp. M1531]|uniref:PepSY domain-containing protein n=1 Tax=Thalassotalea algicola TaxID=2716224 RepID=A0A7Y0LEJ8_9GAMM|nr:PepSY-associated TM helix domain-containing protein [Thalassotalea algicola]NMP32797.1 PepSY domain-containing protein [Thalassotalea algicola]
MKSKSIKKLYTLHSWVGVITGILLFVIAFTGAVSVFGRPEIKLWANPEIRALAPIDTIKIEQLIEEYSHKVPEHYKEEILVFLPAVRSSTKLFIMFESHHGELVDEAQVSEGEKPKHNPPVAAVYEFDPVTYELTDEKRGLVEELFADSKYDMSEFIVGFHADLHMGRPIGLLTTGVLGLTMMLSIVTGIFIHRKILAQMFTFRPRKSYSLMLNDGHKAIGVWGLLFNSVIAFTGAFLGLAIVVLVPAAAFVSFGGDQEKLIETFTAVPDPIIQNVQQPTAVAQSFDHILTLEDGLEVNTLTIKGYGDATAMMYFGASGGKKMGYQTIIYNGKGEFLKKNTTYQRLDGYAGIILDVMFPLHFGNFGGIFVKIIWTVLGIGTALLPLTGLMLWLERGVNAANPKYSLDTYQRFNRLIVGGCGGIVIATFLLFPSQMFFKYLYPVENIGRALWWPFFGSWLLVLFVASIAPCEKKVAKQLANITAFILLSIFPIDVVVTGLNLFTQWSHGQLVSLGIDVTCFTLGVYLLTAIKKFDGVKNDVETHDVIVKTAQEGA